MEPVFCAAILFFASAFLCTSLPLRAQTPSLRHFDDSSPPLRTSRRTSTSTSASSASVEPLPKTPNTANNPTPRTSKPITVSRSKASELSNPRPQKGSRESIHSDRNGSGGNLYPRNIASDSSGSYNHQLTRLVQDSALQSFYPSSHNHKDKFKQAQNQSGTSSLSLKPDTQQPSFSSSHLELIQTESEACQPGLASQSRGLHSLEVPEHKALRQRLGSWEGGSESGRPRCVIVWKVRPEDEIVHERGRRRS